MATVIKRKLISVKLFVENGVYETCNLVTVYEDGKLIASSNEHTTITQEDYDKIRKSKFVDGLVSAQLEQIAEKDEEIKLHKEEKAVLVSEKLALIDEVELHKSEKEEIKMVSLKE